MGKPGGGKGAKSAAAAQAPPPAADATPFDAVTNVAELRRLCASLQAEGAQLAAQATAARLDRDTAETLLAAAHEELAREQLAAVVRAHEADAAAQRHAAEQRSLEQRVKFLQYEQGVAQAETAAAGASSVADAGAEHSARDGALRAEAAGLRARARQLQASHDDAIAALKTAHERSLGKLAQEYDGTLDGLRRRYAERLAALREELALRHRVELRDAEERRGAHIAQLTAAHNASYGEIKSYYQDITRSNLELITTLKAQIADAREKAAANGVLTGEIAQENARLADPLQRATAELVSLQSDLLDVDKDRASLAAARARLAVRAACGRGATHGML